jgi:hypothetical protein
MEEKKDDKIVVRLPALGSEGTYFLETVGKRKVFRKVFHFKTKHRHEKEVGLGIVAVHQAADV